MIMEESEMMSSMICRAEDRLGSTEYTGRAPLERLLQQ